MMRHDATKAHSNIWHTAVVLHTWSIILHKVEGVSDGHDTMYSGTITVFQILASCPAKLSTPKGRQRLVYTRAQTLSVRVISTTRALGRRLLPDW
jgi:hypothetical protein